ncbi:MAG: GTPase [Methylococcaceae bacterium]|jgi:GTPase SAR1 family protein
MLDFIQILKQRYQAALTQQGIPSVSSEYALCIDQLLLAEAFIRKGQLLASDSHTPLQIAILGPTQAGKSSIVNVLLNANLAEVSPLAGYTRHAQGFCHDLQITQCHGLQRYFGRFQQLPRGLVATERYDCYFLSESPHASPYLPACVCWDTPDFDSIDAGHYREGVLRALALADMIVLVVSKEKYADQSVWDMMATLTVLQQPTLICLNKLVEGTEALLIESLKEKWQHARSDEFPGVVPLYYQKPAGMPIWPAAHAQVLLKLVEKANQGRKRQSRYEQAFLQQHWQNWLAPVRAEQQILAEWQDLVEQLVQQGMQQYQRDFLNHPYHYETFQYALTELLNLLELPGFAGLLAGTRRVLTWPLRQLMSLGRKRMHIVDTSQEMALLEQIAEHMLIQLADKLLDKTGQGNASRWWQAAASELRSQRPALLQSFTLAAKNYHLDFQQEVEKAARQLYEKLQEQPFLLNSLRATRATADAAAIALALHTGGIGLHDLVIAPAMLSLTSLLTESAIGSYVHKVEAELKQQQFSKVKQQLLMGVMQEKLAHLPEQLSQQSFFNISPEQLEAAELQLKDKDKRHGLRLF